MSKMLLVPVQPTPICDGSYGALPLIAFLKAKETAILFSFRKGILIVDEEE